MDKFLKIQKLHNKFHSLQAMDESSMPSMLIQSPDMDVKLHLFETMRSVKDEFIGNPNSVELKDFK
jgi:hypothetical protein